MSNLDYARHAKVLDCEAEFEMELRLQRSEFYVRSFSDLHEDTDGDDCSTKKMMFSHLSRFGSKSFAEEQLVLIEQHLYKLCDKACGSPMCISQIQMCQNSIEEV